MKLISTLLGAVLASGGCSAELSGSGKRAAQTREVPPFSRVEIRGSANLVATVGVAQSVTVETDGNLLDNITTDVSDHALVVSSKRSYRSKIGVTVTITAPALVSMATRGSGDIRATGIATEVLDVDIMGSGNVRAAGRAETLRVEIAGSGDAMLQNLVAKRVDVDIAGSGNARVHATDELDASIMGSGDVAYRGEPKVRSQVAGGGEVEKE